MLNTLIAIINGLEGLPDTINSAADSLTTTAAKINAFIAYATATIDQYAQYARTYAIIMAVLIVVMLVILVALVVNVARLERKIDKMVPAPEDPEEETEDNNIM